MAELVSVAETERGPAGGSGLVLGTGYALEPEFVELERRAGPESVHGFGLEAVVGVEYLFGAGAEGVSQQ